MKEEGLVFRKETQKTPEYNDRSPLRQRIKNGLLGNTQLYVTEEVVETGLDERTDGDFLEEINFYVAPQETSYDDKILNNLLTTVLPNIPREPHSPNGPNQFHRSEHGKDWYPMDPLREFDRKIGDKTWTLGFATLTFNEIVGVKQEITDASRIIPSDIELFKKLNIDTGLKGDKEEIPLYREINVYILPEKWLADVAQQFNAVYQKIPEHKHKRFSQQDGDLSVYLGSHMRTWIDEKHYLYLHSEEFKQAFSAFKLRYSNP